MRHYNNAKVCHLFRFNLRSKSNNYIIRLFQLTSGKCKIVHKRSIERKTLQHCTVTENSNEIVMTFGRPTQNATYGQTNDRMTEDNIETIGIYVISN